MEDISEARDIFNTNLLDGRDKQGSLSDAEFRAWYKQVLGEVAALFNEHLKRDWWPIRGTLIAFMRYGQTGAEDFAHPDL